MTASRVVVTGSSGFIGSRVVPQLRDAGAEVIAIPHRWRSRDELCAALGDGPVDRCVHAGWYADPSDYLTAVAANEASLRSSLQLVDVVAERGCGHLLAVGSSAEYASSVDRLTEAHPVDPWSCYGATKAALRLLLRSSRRPGSLRFGWARVFNVTGPGEHADRLVPWVVRTVLAGDRVALTSGEQVRDFLDVEDVAHALALLSTDEVEGDVNVCSGRGIALRDLLERAADRLGRVDLLDFGVVPRGIHDADMVVGDNERLLSHGWVPRYDVDAIITRVVEYWTSTQRGCDQT